MVTCLAPHYDSAKSFHDKAEVIDNETFWKQGAWPEPGERVEWAEEVKRLQAEWREQMLLEEAERNAGLDEALRGLWRAGVPKRWLYTVCNGNRPRVDAALDGEER